MWIKKNVCAAALGSWGTFAKCLEMVRILGWLTWWQLKSECFSRVTTGGSSLPTNDPPCPPCDTQTVHESECLGTCLLPVSKGWWTWLLVCVMLMMMLLTTSWFIKQKRTDLFDNWVVVEWPEQEEPLLITWILGLLLFFQWLQTNARTAVWSNMLVWLELQWKVTRAIEYRLRTSPCSVNNKAGQWGNRRLQLSGELKDTGYGQLAST